MKSLYIMAVALVVSPAHGDEASKIAKKQADEMNQAVLKGDYGKLADMTYPALVDFMGGREKMIAATETIMKTLKAQGIEILSNKLAEPGEITKDDGKSYIVISSSMEMKAPMGKIRMKSYLLGVSADDGKTWKFLDGAGLANKELREKVLPNFPAKVKLPEPQQPEIIKD